MTQAPTITTSNTPEKGSGGRAPGGVSRRPKHTDRAACRAHPAQSLLPEQTLRVPESGRVELPANALRWAQLRRHCSVKINAAERTITITPGHDHILCHDGAVSLSKELNALRIDPARVSQSPPTLERKRRDHHRELVLRFAPDAIKPRVSKNPVKQGKNIKSGGSPQRREERGGKA